jgi:hypothetical protein
MGSKLYRINLDKEKAELAFSEAQKCLSDLHKANGSLMKKLETFFNLFVVIVIAITGYWFNTFFIEEKTSPVLFWFITVIIAILLFGAMALLIQINAYNEKPSGSEPDGLLTNAWMKHPIDCILWSLSDLYQERINQAKNNNRGLALAVHRTIWFIAILPFLAFLVLLIGYVFHDLVQTGSPLFGYLKLYPYQSAAFRPYLHPCYNPFIDFHNNFALCATNARAFH